MNILYFIFANLFLSSALCAHEPWFDGREIQGKIIPVPNTVSIDIQRVIAAPLEQRERKMAFVPTNKEEWNRVINENARSCCDKLKAFRKHFPMRSIEKAHLNGVNAFLVTPECMDVLHEDRLLIFAHGGAFVFSEGEAGLPEAILMAHYSKCRVLAIDYRMPPLHPFPAALDDMLTVYREVLKKFKPEKIAFFGSSAGANIIAASLLNFRTYNLPMPAAVSLGNIIADLENNGDSRATNEFIDNNIISYNGFLKAAFTLYAGGFDLRDPLLSPVNGDFSKGFPPTILTSGTRDLLLSDTVRMYSRLRSENIEAKMQVIEGLSHGQYLTIPNAPESQLALKEIALFLNNHLSMPPAKIPLKT